MRLSSKSLLDKSKLNLRLVSKIVSSKISKLLTYSIYDNDNRQTVNLISYLQKRAFTDKNISYIDIADFVELHITEKLGKQTTKEILKWVHITISNAKRNLLDNFYKIKRKYLLLYLNGFDYKFNKIYFGERLFDRLLTI